MAEALIVDACRTPRGIGEVDKGSLAHLQRLGAAVLPAIQERHDLDAADIDDIIWGTPIQRGGRNGACGDHRATLETIRRQ